MLPFFRKIRWRYARDNQFFKYSRYAIGEIILVMVGILLALQVNNWNENRKGRLKLEVYQKRLIKDLVNDTIALHSFIEACESEKSRWLRIQTEIEKPSSTIDTLIEYFLSSDMGYMPMLSNKNDATYRSLLSTGDIELFEDSYRMLLMDFYHSVGPRYGYILKWQESGVSDFEETFTDFGWLTKENKNNLIYQKLREDMDQSEFIKMFDIVVGRRTFFYNAYIIEATEILSETKMVLESFDSEL